MARDPNRIKPFLAMLEVLWSENPDMRFGQLVLNVSGERNVAEHTWTWEDDKWIERIVSAHAAHGGWHDDWPTHQPAAPEAPIPGRHWYSGCDPDRPRVNPLTGRCESCGEEACPICGREDCPDHAR